MKSTSAGPQEWRSRLTTHLEAVICDDRGSPGNLLRPRCQAAGQQCALYGRALLKSLGTGACKDPRTPCGSVSFNFLNCFEGCQAEQTASGATAQPYPCYPVTRGKGPRLGARHIW